HFENSQCPDHLCEGFGEIYFDNQSASCLPAGVIVTIDEAVQ
ncbi:MAG: NusG domain II-containing protein, partial [Oscillospiraceae bacterium]|nr:NusG domain II-containing protein [Oscillospiraceae bacterium]